MKILVTGGAGFIGSNLVELLLSQSHEVVIADDLSSGKRSNIDAMLDRAVFYLQDIREPEVDRIFEAEKPEVVVHLAAQTSVPVSVEDPLLDEEINVRGIVNLLVSCVKHNVKKFIFISTGGAIYGDADVIPTSESYVPDFISPYALTKYTSENYLRVFNKMHGLEYSVLRLSNVYGPKQVPKGECGVVPIFFEQCIADAGAILYTYSDMPRGTSRDYVYVKDVCRAVSLCLEGGSGELFNIGTGAETYTRDAFEQIKALTGSSSELTVEGERAGDVRRSLLDCGKAGRILGWAPEVDFATGLEYTYEWIKSRG